MAQRRLQPRSSRYRAIFVGQYRAMRQSIAGKVGIQGNVESETYRRPEWFAGSNPTLTATLPNYREHWDLLTATPGPTPYAEGGRVSKIRPEEV